MHMRCQASKTLDVGFSVLRMFHPEGFVIDRPKGLKDEHLFIHFLAPAKMRLRGRDLRLEAGACFIYPPGEPQLYGGDGTGLGNDAFHISGPGVSGILRKCGIPLATPLLPVETWRIAELCAGIHAEYVSKSELSPEVFKAQFSLLCVELSRRLAESREPRLSPRARELKARLKSLRLMMLSRISEPWDLRRLAKEACLGRSRLCSLYASFFGRSPVDELIDARIEMAKSLLSGGNCTVAEAAGLCGFSSPQYFCRVFKARAGKPPGSFR